MKYHAGRLAILSLGLAVLRLGMAEPVDIHGPGASDELLRLLANSGIVSSSPVPSKPDGTNVSPGDNPGFLLQHELPSSFVYGGQPSATLLATWQKELKPPVEQADRTIYECTWREPGGGLAATWRAEAFHDWPAIEFRWTFVNEGKAPTKPLTQVHALELNATLGNRAFKVLHSTGGGVANTNSDDLNDPGLGFAMSESDGGVIDLRSEGGVSSNRDLPFLLVHAEQPEEGLFVGIGWSGQWQAKIDGSNLASGLRLTAEMPDMNLALPPGERIISPSILLGTYKGAMTAGSNTLRRLLYAKYVPLLNGGKPLPPVSWNSWIVLGNNISEDILEKQADGAARAGVEYFCIDAVWFDGGCPGGIGNWTVDKAKFPKGLGAIGDYVAGKGMKLGVWFEPERIEAKTRVLLEHPEWIKDDVVDLGNKDARDWYFAMMKGLIDEAHIRWIRLDFNRTFPLSTWNATDTHDRKGLAQIRHIMGLYEVLDRLMKAYPDLLIESCAGGARRDDLEMIKRSHSTWITDNCDIPIVRFKETGANTFLPGVLLNTNMLPENNVAFNSQSIFGGAFGLRCDFTKLDPATFDRLTQEIVLAKKLRPLLDADYYPLIPQSRDIHSWLGWQFDDPAKGAGYIVVLRPGGSPNAGVDVALKGLDAGATYTLTPLDGTAGDARQLTGAQLAQPWSVKLKTPASGAIYEYSKTKKALR
jgi:alpha-galactosidase